MLATCLASASRLSGHQTRAPVGRNQPELGDLKDRVGLTGSSVPGRCSSSAVSAVPVGARPRRPVPDSKQAEAHHANDEQHPGKGMHADACDPRPSERPAQRTGDQDAARAWCEEMDRPGNCDDPVSGESNGATAATDQKGQSGDNGEHAQENSQGNRYGWSPERSTFWCRSTRHTSSGGPRRRESPRVECAVPEQVFRLTSLGLSLFEVGRQVCGHLVGDGIRDSEPPPLPAALIDELTHGITSALTTPSAPSTASRAACHSLTPASSARSPSGERL